MRLVSFDDECRVLELQRAELDLKKFVDLRVLNDDPLWISEIVYIFKELLE